MRMRYINLLFTYYLLTNAKVSTRQPWYIGHNSLNHPSLAFFTVTASTTSTCLGYVWRLKIVIFAHCILIVDA